MMIEKLQPELFPLLMQVDFDEMSDDDFVCFFENISTDSPSGQAILIELHNLIKLTLPGLYVRYFKQELS